jgi:hypothetical protein
VRKGYVFYVKKGIALGRRPELVGGGLIRSLGGWDEVKKSPAQILILEIRECFPVAKIFAFLDLEQNGTF